MIQIYPDPKNDKYWIVEYDFFDIPTNWGNGKKTFVSWQAAISYSRRIMVHYQILRRIRKISNFINRN